MPDLHGDPQLVSFIARELIKNAVEALPNGAGRVVVALKHLPNRKIIQALFRDSGHGIPENLRDRVFQPFFTTKEHRQGLSLSRARRYAEFHNGTLELLESGGTGTMFQLELPIGDAPPRTIPVMSPRRPDPRSA
jgi:signal transduction histidine kinase